MNCKIFFCCGLVGLVSAFSQTADTTSMDQRIRTILEMKGRDLKAETWKRSKEEREMIIREVLKRLHPNTTEATRSDLLVTLGDRKTTQEEVAKVVASPFFSGLGLSGSGSPYVVEFLAPSFFGTEPYSLTGGDTPTSPLSFMAAITALRVMQQSSAFNGEVISWARRVDQADRTELRAEMQRWWKENEEHFKAENWLAVQPGRDLETLASRMAKERAGIDRIASTPAGTVNPNLTQKAAVSQPSSAQSSDSGIFVYIAGGIVALLVAAITLMRRGARSHSGQ